MRHANILTEQPAREHVFGPGAECERGGGRGSHRASRAKLCRAWLVPRKRDREFRKAGCTKWQRGLGPRIFPPGFFSGRYQSSHQARMESSVI